MKKTSADIAIVGGGICGLALALNLHQRGIACRVYERVADMKERGVGMTLLPHAIQEFSALGLADDLLKTGIENEESCCSPVTDTPKLAFIAAGCIRFYTMRHVIAWVRIGFKRTTNAWE